jgi:hypothetical protein
MTENDGRKSWMADREKPAGGNIEDFPGREKGNSISF